MLPRREEHEAEPPIDWAAPLRRLVEWMQRLDDAPPYKIVMRLKQWLKMASIHGSFSRFPVICRAMTVEELFAGLQPGGILHE